MKLTTFLPKSIFFLLLFHDEDYKIDQLNINELDFCLLIIVYIIFVSITDNIDFWNKFQVNCPSDKEWLLAKHFIFGHVEISYTWRQIDTSPQYFFYYLSN